MLFYPFGVMNEDVVGPEKLAEEFREAQRVASNCTQYQFNENVFHHEDLERDSHVKIMSAGKTIQIGIADASAPDLVDLSMFEIPYNRGLGPISDTSVDWVSPYTELVHAVFSFQYARDFTSQYNNGRGCRIRAQIRIAIDGSPVSGAGPFGVPFDGLSWGTGFAYNSHYTSIHAMAIVPAGAHRIEGVAGLVNAAIGGRRVEGSSDTWDDPPTEKIVIANREMIVMRFARGTNLEG